MQCVAGYGFRIFEMWFQLRFAVLVPLKCGFICCLRVLSVVGTRLSSNFDGVFVMTKTSFFGRTFKKLFWQG